MVLRLLALVLAAASLVGCEAAQGPAAAPTPRVATRDCTRPSGVAAISFSATRYPNIRRHFLRALRQGWPRVLTLHRPGADDRRDELLSDVPSSENRSHGAVLGIKLRRFCEGTRFRYVFY